MSLFGKDPPAAARAAQDVIACFAEAKAQHHAVEQSGRQALAAARKAGKVLLTARAKTPFGQWTATVEANWPGQIRTCRVYIQIAENWSRVATAASIREALKILTEDPPDEDEDDPKTAAGAAVLPSDDDQNEEPDLGKLFKKFERTFGPLNRVIDEIALVLRREVDVAEAKEPLNELLRLRDRWRALAGRRT